MAECSSLLYFFGICLNSAAWGVDALQCKFSVDNTMGVTKTGRHMDAHANCMMTKLMSLAPGQTPAASETWKI